MKKVARFASHTQAFLTSQLLLSRGIKSEIVGSREYSSIVVGSDEGRFDLMVDWQDETESLKILKEIDSQTISDKDRLRPTANSYLKKAITHALLACVLIPIVFNYASLKALGEFRKLETDENRKLMMTIFVILLQLPTFFITYYLIKHLGTDFDQINAILDGQVVE